MTHVYMCTCIVHVYCACDSGLIYNTQREGETDWQTDRQTAVLEFPFLKSTNQENKLKFSTDSRLSGIHTEIFKTVTIQGPTPSPTASQL